MDYVFCPSHYAAFGVGWLALATVAFQKLQLLRVDGTPSTLSNVRNGIEGAHPGLHQGNGYEHRSPSQTSDTMDRNSDSMMVIRDIGIGRVVLEAGLDEIQPVGNDSFRRCFTISKTKLMNLDAVSLNNLSGVGGIAHTDHIGDTVLFHLLDVEMQIGLRGGIHNQEAHLLEGDQRGRIRQPGSAAGSLCRSRVGMQEGQRGLGDRRFLRRSPTALVSSIGVRIIDERWRSQSIDYGDDQDLVQVGVE